MRSSGIADTHSPVQANMYTGHRLSLVLSSGADCLPAAAVVHLCLLTCLCCCPSIGLRCPIPIGHSNAALRPASKDENTRLY